LPEEKYGESSSGRSVSRLPFYMSPELTCCLMEKYRSRKIGKNNTGKNKEK
jgi:hypothetical protein